MRVQSIRIVLAVLAALALAAALPQPARSQASGYSFLDLGTLGGTMSVATGVNDLGQVVGYSFLPGGTTLQWDEHAFYWENGVLLDMGTLGGRWSKATAINNRGDVVGRAQRPDLPPGGNQVRPFYWNNVARVMTDLNTYLSPADRSHWQLTEAWDINDDRKVVGSGEVLSEGAQLGKAHAYLLDLSPVESGQPAAIADLGTLPGLTGGLDAWGDGLNNLPSPQVVGLSRTGPTYQDRHAPFLFSGTLPLFDLSPMYYARDINDAGGVVGTVNDHPAYRSPGGAITDLGSFDRYNLPGEARAISNTGDVVGWAEVMAKGLNRPRAFRWTVGGGPMRNLNDLTTGRGKNVLRYAHDVSDTGFIAGAANKNSQEGTLSDRACRLAPQ